MEKHPLYSQSCLLSLLLLILLTTVSTIRGRHPIYLVLIEGEPVAFQQENLNNTFNIKSKLRLKAHAKRLVEHHDQVLQSALCDGGYKKLYSFKHIINGFAVQTSPSQAKRLELAPEVLRVEIDPGVKLMTTYTPELLDLPEGAWAQAGGVEKAGEGMVIGVIDSGIDPSHPSFAYDPLYNDTMHKKRRLFNFSCDEGPLFPVGSCNGKIISARYFAAGASEAFHLKASDLSPFDQNGHGSHVASIAAGNDGVPVVVNGCKFGFASGMAPRARLAIYKAMYPQGGTLADLISAVDQAAQDGVDVIVLSIGPQRPPEGELSFMSVFEISLLFARRAGIFVVQAAGNEGPAEATVVTFSPWAMGVAASTTGRAYSTPLVMGDGRKLNGVGYSVPTAGEGEIQLRLVLAADAAEQNGTTHSTGLQAGECQNPEALQPAEVFGSIVICSFSKGFLSGTSTITAITNTAKLLGFAGFVLAANPLYGDFVAQPLPLTVPGVMLTRVADVEVLLDYYHNASSGATASIKEGRVAAFGEQAPIVAPYSSRGPDFLVAGRIPADVLKPDVLAPGHQVWAAWSAGSTLEPVLAGDSFALLSGTSMAAPHVAGIAALVRQSHASWTPSMIASAISTTAVCHDSRGQPIMAQSRLGYPLSRSTPFDRGAGFVNPVGSLDPGLVFPAEFDDYVSFLCSLPAVDPSAVRASTGKKCDHPFSSPADLNLPSLTISDLAGVQVVRRTAVNVAGKLETYTCSAAEPEGVEVAISPQWFTVLPGERQELEIRLAPVGGSGTFVFGEIVLTGSLGHIVRMPLSVATIAAPPE